MQFIWKVAIICSSECPLTQNGIRKLFWRCFLRKNEVIKIIPKSKCKNGYVAVLKIWAANRNRYAYNLANIKTKQLSTIWPNGFLKNWNLPKLYWNEFLSKFKIRQNFFLEIQLLFTFGNYLVFYIVINNLKIIE